MWRDLEGDLLEPRYSPVLALGSGLVVGAEVVAPRVLTREVAQAFAFGLAAEEGWWIDAGLRPGQLAAPGAVGALVELLETSGLPAERLVLPLTPAELTQAVRGGTAAALGALGVRFTVPISLAGRCCSNADDVARVRSVVHLARSCGAAVIGRGVDSDEQLTLAGEAGVAFASGYWWGSPGSLAKLVGTWARLPVSG